MSIHVPLDATECAMRVPLDGTECDTVDMRGQGSHHIPRGCGILVYRIDKPQNLPSPGWQL